MRKVQSYRLDAFDAGEAGPIACIEEGRVRRFRAWPEGQALGLTALGIDAQHWPRVALLTSHAGAEGALVDALVAAGMHGLVVAGCGNGNVHAALEVALQQALAAGVAVLRVSRCAYGGVVGADSSALPAAPGLNGPQARVELMLRLMPKPA